MVYSSEEDEFLSWWGDEDAEDDDSGDNYDAGDDNDDECLVVAEGMYFRNLQVLNWVPMEFFFETDLDIDGEPIDSSEPMQNLHSCFLIDIILNFKIIIIVII